MFAHLLVFTLASFGNLDAAHVGLNFSDYYRENSTRDLPNTQNLIHSANNIALPIMHLSTATAAATTSPPTSRETKPHISTVSTVPMTMMRVPIILYPSGASLTATLQPGQHNSSQQNMIFAIPTPSPISDASLHINIEPTVKKSRLESQDVDESIASYIEHEINLTQFKKKVKRLVLKKAIEFIFRNDYDGFLSYEPEFVKVIGCKYHLFKRGPCKAKYMMHYIIRFGATNFLKFYSNTQIHSDEDSNIEEAFEFLIYTKPLDVVFQFLRVKHHLNRSSVRGAIVDAVRNRYPELHLLDYLVFESNNQFELALKIFEAKGESEKFERLTDLLNAAKDENLEIQFSDARILATAISYPNYFMSLDRKLKLLFAKVAILNESEEVLLKIFDLDPELAIDTSESSLFAYATKKRKTKMIPFFMEIVKELATYEEVGEPSPIAISITQDSADNLKAFDSCGIDLREQICYEGNLVTPTQLAFRKRSPESLAYLIEKFGADYTMNQLLELYKTRNDIISHALNPRIVIGIAELLRDKLGFDFKDRYHFNAKTGNAMIFVDDRDHMKPFLKFTFNL